MVGRVEVLVHRPELQSAQAELADGALELGDATRELPGPRKEAPPATAEEFERYFTEMHQALDATGGQRSRSLPDWPP